MFDKKKLMLSVSMFLVLSQTVNASDGQGLSLSELMARRQNTSSSRGHVTPSSRSQAPSRSVVLPSTTDDDLDALLASTSTVKSKAKPKSKQTPPSRSVVLPSTTDDDLDALLASTSTVKSKAKPKSKQTPPSRSVVLPSTTDDDLDALLASTASSSKFKKPSVTKKVLKKKDSGKGSPPVEYTWRDISRRLSGSPLLGLGEDTLGPILQTFGNISDDLWGALKNPQGFIDELNAAVGYDPSLRSPHRGLYASWGEEQRRYYTGGTWPVLGTFEDSMLRLQMGNHASTHDFTQNRITWFHNIITLVDTFFWSRDHGLLDEYLGEVLSGSGGGDGPCGPGKMRFVEMWREDQENLIDFKGGTPSSGSGVNPIVNAATKNLKRMLTLSDASAGMELSVGMPVIVNAIFHKLMMELLKKGEVPGKYGSVELPDIFRAKKTGVKKVDDPMSVVKDVGVAKPSISTGTLLMATEEGDSWINETSFSPKQFQYAFEEIWDQYAEGLANSFQELARNRFTELGWDTSGQRKPAVDFKYPVYGGYGYGYGYGGIGASTDNLWSGYTGTLPFSGITIPTNGDRQNRLKKEFDKYVVVTLSGQPFHAHHFGAIIGSYSSSVVLVLKTQHTMMGQNVGTLGFSLDKDMTRLANAGILSAINIYFQSSDYIKEQLETIRSSLSAKGVDVVDIPAPEY